MTWLRPVAGRHALAVAALLAMPCLVQAQAPRKPPPTVAVVFSAAPIASLAQDMPTNSVAKVIRAGLEERGWVDGRNIQLLWRSAESRLDLAPQLIKPLVEMPVDVIVAFGDVLPREAKRQTQTIPIVLGGYPDPVASRFVASLARPGGNVTGLTFMGAEESATRPDRTRRCGCGRAGGEGPVRVARNLLGPGELPGSDASCG